MIELESTLLQDANVGHRLTRQAIARPDMIAIASPVGSYRQGTHRTYRSLSMIELERRATTIASGFQSIGIGPGKRIALLVRFGEDFITLVFALLKTGATIILIDPGMGRSHLLDCLEAAQPDGFVAIPMAQAIVRFYRSRFARARLNVTVGKRWWGLPSPTLEQLERGSARHFEHPTTALSDPAAIIFTTGSTGPPKGVLYTHQTFQAQIDQVAEHYAIEPGGKDLSAFPLFGLFNAVMGTTTIIPDMNPTRPADVDPIRLIDAMDQWDIPQSFGSPALWTKVGAYCNARGRSMPSLRRVLSAGAPVPARILEQVRRWMHPEGMVYTPYGATEALPVASIESREVLGETAERTRQGAGTCVGHRFSGIEWRVIPIQDGPIERIEHAGALGPNAIGELMVRGSVVSTRYVTRTDQNRLHKVIEGDTVWHRMGDVGYLDEQDRFWFCGRKGHRVTTADRVLFTEPIEAIINTHANIYRSALVGIGPKDKQRPVVVVEPWPKSQQANRLTNEQLIAELQTLAGGLHQTASIEKFMVCPGKLPTDIRHNSKIFREQVAQWATDQQTER